MACFGGISGVCGGGDVVLHVLGALPILSLSTILPLIMWKDHCLAVLIFSVSELFFLHTLPCCYFYDAIFL